MGTTNQRRQPRRYENETFQAETVGGVTSFLDSSPPSSDVVAQSRAKGSTRETPLREGQILAGLLEAALAGANGDRSPLTTQGAPRGATLEDGGNTVACDRGLAVRAGSRGVGFPSPSLAKLTRRFLEDAFVRLSEENARLRHQVKAASSFWQIAHQDPLTGLWNRRYADERLAEEMSRAKRESGYKFSMVLIDVDNLKRINDENGHASGDEALKWVGEFLREGLRGHDLSCRIGGDEFLLILPGSGQQECKNLVERIRRRWRAAASAGEGTVTVSMGTATFPIQGSTVDVLLAVADESMYANKRRQESTHLLSSP
jgi:diguanylate cyclase (GGDEF)-like protein